VPKKSNYMDNLHHDSSFIPEGNNIFTHTYTLQRNPRYFSPYPDSFWPDRWLPENDRQKAPFNEEFILDLAAFNPFSYGPANCAGKNLALLELRVITCFIVQKFNLKVKEGFKIETWEEGVDDFFVVKRPPLPVIMETRRF
jgi:cytochrome P450